MLASSKVRLLFFLSFIAISLFFFSSFLRPNVYVQKKSAEPTVLGSNYQSPQIYISGGENGSSSGGLIALASTDEPAIVLGGYNISGDVQISMYEADENSMIDYLTHDKDGKQNKKAPDVSKFRYITDVKQAINTSSYQGSKVTLPFSETGIWYLKVKIGSTQANAFVIRSNIGVLAKEGDNEFIFWGQNFKTKRSISAGVVKIYNLTDSRKELQTVSFTAEGIAKANLTAEADIALITQDNNRAVVPLNLKYLNTGYYGYEQFAAKTKQTKYFIFTDRPLYKPGDTIYFKSILRDDDDARYTIPTDNVLVKIYPGYDDKNAVFEKSFPVSADGTISGEYKLPANTKTGYYALSLNNSTSISFDVEFFKKPEFFIDVAAPTTELIASDKTFFKINGSYFSGQPLIGQKVKYTVSASDFYEYQYHEDMQNYYQTISADYRYGYWYGSNKVAEGTVDLDQNGEAEINLDAKMPWNKGRTQVFSIEATIDDGSQSPSFSRKNILVYAGEYGIFRKDSSYGVKINTPLSLPVALVPYRNNFNVSEVNLTAKIHRTDWISYQDPAQKYLSYRKEEEDLPDLSAKTDKNGNATFTFTPTKIGSYNITISGQDARGNQISKIFYSYVTADDQPYYTDNGNSEISISTDKQKYLPTDTVKLNIFSQTPDRDVFLALERGRVNAFEVVHLNGKNGAVEIPLVDTDIPNIFAKVSSFSSSALDSNQKNILVSPNSKKLVVNITPDSKTYGPGETANVAVTTTDVKGNPVSTELALWTVDKAIFELSENKLGDIFETFWKTRYDNTQEAHSLEGIFVRMSEMGGCFGPGTKVLMGDGTVRNIEDVKIGDYVLTRSSNSNPDLVKAKVLGTHKADEGGYLIINGNLKITANHIMRANNTWKEAGSIQIGDFLIDNKNQTILVTSVEWQKTKTAVYNLEIEKYHTFFANGVWVHNQKGGVERQTFKDTAYWNPSVRTDSAGRAQISFKLPDNLTTWTLAAVAATKNTAVGQTTTEIIVTKDIIVRPILPNILRTGDEIILSALVQNFTPNDHQFDVGLKFDSGAVEDEIRPDTLIKTNKMDQFYWKVKPEKAAEKSKLIFSAVAKEDNKLADIVTQEIPVRAFGFEEKRAETGEGAKTFNVTLAPDSSKDKSQITLALSPTIIGTLPTAMKYLINYPYGCVEQTTSRFVPAVIAKLNQDLFSEALKDKDIDAIIDKGLSRLLALQQGDGGWAWWSSGKSDPFITAYVTEYILAAKQAGMKIDAEITDGIDRYLTQETPTKEDEIAKIYALSLLGKKDKVRQITDFNLSADLLSLAVMANYLNGNSDPQSNGLNQLISMAKVQGDALFWEAGDKLHFGSRDASTALAVRAIVLAGGDRNQAVKGARFLTRTHQTEYWSNTYATAQVIRALVDLSKTGEELTPNYTYAVTLDGKQVSQGTVSSSKQAIKEISIPVANIKPEGSNIVVTKSGDGQIYSTLVINEFRTDKNAKAEDHGLSITREYINAKGSEYSLGVGDTVIVRITLGGLKANENYGIIHDELPSGLVPINEAFKNEQYGTDPNYYYTSYDVTDKDVTENGMTLSLYQIAAVDRTYTYKARVVSEGTFIVPPATASLMYAPEISGRSEVQTIKIAKKSQFFAKKNPEQPSAKISGREMLLTGVLLMLITGIGILTLKRKGITLQSIKDAIRKILHKQ